MNQLLLDSPLWDSGTDSKTREQISTRPAILNAQKKVLKAVYEHEDGLTRTQISAFTGLKINNVCGRVAELLQNGLLSEEGRRLNPFTGKHNKVLVVKK